MKAVIPRSDIIGPLLKEIEDFARTHGRYYSEVLESLLDYIIFCFDIDHTPIPWWKYNQEETAKFHQMMATYFLQMEEALKHRSWYDMFGDLFMAWAGDKKYRGQCFTPMDLCDVLAHVTLDGRIDEAPVASCRAFGKRVIVNDCACGSSRTLLAGHAIFIDKGLRKPYLIGEDLDAMCCKMSAVNLMSHGCYGEVVCHNTLTEPGEVRMGFVVNEGMYPFVGIPTIRRENKPELLVTTAVWRRKKEQAERMKAEEPQPKKQEAVQLSLFLC